jgi:hypothetical protein
MKAVRGILFGGSALMVAFSGTSAAAQNTHALVVVGLGGTEEYRQEFHGLAAGLHDALRIRFGLPTERVHVLSEKPEQAPQVVRDRSTRDNIVAVLGEMATSADPGDRILVVLIGHGTARGEEASINLPGPDLSATDFAAALGAFSTQTVALVHTGSASGGFVKALSGPNRVIITATRTARERNATEFPHFFVEALEGDGSDLDKDGQVSLLEAFQYARREVERHYEEENEILTEHALLDDNGDGEGTGEVGDDSPDGRLAATFRLGAASVRAAPDTDDPVLARMYEERRQIQERLDQLRAVRETMTAERYEEELEAILVELALKNREIREREGGGS